MTTPTQKRVVIGRTDVGRYIDFALSEA